MPTIRHLTASIALICLTGVAAMGFEPLAATIRVTSGSLYDYVIVGEHSLATDGYDNAYDTLSPGNLNADMGQPYISAVIIHPEWKRSRQELRGDIRSPAKRQVWQLAIASSLAKGAPLTIDLQKEKSTLPRGVKVTVKDEQTTTDLTTGSCTLPAPGPNARSTATLTVEQP